MTEKENRSSGIKTIIALIFIFGSMIGILQIGKSIFAEHLSDIVATKEIPSQTFKVTKVTIKGDGKLYKDATDGSSIFGAVDVIYTLDNGTTYTEEIEYDDLTKHAIHDVGSLVEKTKHYLITYKGDRRMEEQALAKLFNDKDAIEKLDTSTETIESQTKLTEDERVDKIKPPKFKWLKTTPYKADVELDVTYITDGGFFSNNNYIPVKRTITIE